MHVIFIFCSSSFVIVFIEIHLSIARRSFIKMRDLYTANHNQREKTHNHIKTILSNATNLSLRKHRREKTKSMKRIWVKSNCECTRHYMFERLKTFHDERIERKFIEIFIKWQALKSFRIAFTSFCISIVASNKISKIMCYLTQTCRTI